jgi:hypothetical protein
VATTVRSLFSSVVLTFASSCIAAEEPASCRDVSGNFRCNLENSWDMCRIRTPDGAVYSIKRLDSADPALLEGLRVAFDGGVGPLVGSFTVCIIGRNATDTYDGKPVYFATLTAFSLAPPK